MIVVNFAILYLMIDIKINLKNDINSSINKTIKNIDIPKTIKNDVKTNVSNLKVDSLIDNSVNKKVDSLNLYNGVNGTNGENGKDSISTNTIITEKIIEQTPVNGLTPVPRCNKGRWEISFDNGLHWTISFNENNKSERCSFESTNR